MRFEQPQRPDRAADPYLDKLWRWSCQATEQLNLVLDQLERAEVLQPDSGTTLGTLARTAEETQDGLSGAQTALRDLRQGLGSAQETLSDALGGLCVQAGSALIAYELGATTAQVTFARPFTQAPQVLAMQVFDSVPLTVHTSDVTPAGFTARVAGGFSTSGTRSFGWIAVGK